MNCVFKSLHNQTEIVCTIIQFLAIPNLKEIVKTTVMVDKRLKIKSRGTDKKIVSGSDSENTGGQIEKVVGHISTPTASQKLSIGPKKPSRQDLAF